jgi:hypothetical protein
MPEHVQYKTYVAYISQTGTNDPSAHVFQNTLGGEVVWARTNVGRYIGTLAGAFPTNKTIVCPFGDATNTTFLPISSVAVGYFTAWPNSEDTIEVEVIDDLVAYNDVDLSTRIGGNGHGIMIEVRVYP